MSGQRGDGHTAATLMLDAGADVRYVAEMLGHQKLETTMTYTRVSLAKLREVHAATHPAERTIHSARISSPEVVRSIRDTRAGRERGS